MILKQGSRETAQGLAPVIGACENPKNIVTIRVGIPVSQSATAPFRCIIAPCILQGLFIRLDLLDFFLGFCNHTIQDCIDLRLVKNDLQQRMYLLICQQSWL